MRLLGLRALIAGALVVAVLATLAGFAVMRDTGDPGADRAEVVAAPPAPTALADCADLLVVGVDGNGEKARAGKRYGPTVDRFVTSFVTAAQARDRTVEKRVVTIKKTATPRRLVPQPSSRKAARSQITKARAKAWQSPVRKAVGAGANLLDSAARSCADQQIVLAGFAQGASVVHRMLTAVAERSGVSSRIVGAVLVSDPDRRSKSRATRLGGPAAPKKGQGLVAALGKGVPDVRPATAISRTFSVCTKGDLVCDVSKASTRSALKKATSYRRGKGAAVLDRAATSLASLATLRPAPRPRTQVVPVTVGAPVGVQLKASSGQATVAWNASGPMPPGISLSPSGLVSGTARTGGLATVTYTVRGTGPATPPITGQLSLRVASTTDSVAAGGRSSCELHADGTAWCWGGNQWGQVGDGTTTERRAPVQAGSANDWRSLDTSGSSACGIKTGGSLWCWGLNDDGQLGIGGGGQDESPTQVGTLTTWASVSTGWHHTCATQTSGTLWCWGLNESGQLGTGEGSPSTAKPKQVGTGTDWSTVSVGGFYTCGLRAGQAWCWGGNGFGQLGVHPGTNLGSPALVPGPGGLVSLSAGWAHTCASAGDGAAYCWGRNDRGQLGIGSTTDVSAPSRVAGDQTWTSIAVGDAVTCGVAGTGQGWCWGDNRYGQLGNGTTTASTRPVAVVSSAPWVRVELGWFHGCAALSTGRTSCWGNNELGQVGDGGTVAVSSPKEIA